LISMFVLLSLPKSWGQQPSYAERAKRYIALYKDLAVAEQRRTGIPAAVTLAQGIYETSAGASELATKANNHFGIKCKSNWTGETFAHTDDAPNECFRKYPTAEASYRDHSDYLKVTPRYAACFQQAPTDYIAWATQLKRAGYATNPRYAQLIAKVVEDYNLQEYTYAALSDRPAPSNSRYASEFAAEIVPVKDVPAPVKTVPAPVKAAVAEADLVATAEPLTAQAPAPVERPKLPDTSKGVELLNGLQGFYANAGDMLLPAAIRYNVRYAKLLEWNDLTDDAALQYDQFIYLEKKPTRGAYPTHTVRDGENMYLISQMEGVQLRSLRAMNQMENDEEPVVGTVLQMQTTAPIKPRVYYPTQAKPVAVASIPAPAPPQVAMQDGFVQTNNPARVDTVVAAPEPVAVPQTTVETPVAAANTAPIETVAAPEINTAATTTTTTPTQAASTEVESDDPMERLKSRMDKAVYAKSDTKEEKAPEPATPAVIEKKTVSTVGRTTTTTTVITPTRTTTTPAPATTVQAALPKPAPAAGTKSTTATPAPVVPAGGRTTVSAALPKDMVAKQTLPAAATSAPAGNVEFHTVGRGETVFSIAKKYGVTVTDLQAWNKIDFAAIRVGQQLRVKKPE
jgi:LysM repeat protein